MFTGTNILLIRPLLVLGSLLYPLHLQFGYHTLALLSYTLVATIFCRIGRIDKTSHLLSSSQGVYATADGSTGSRFSSPVDSSKSTRYFGYRFLLNIENLSNSITPSCQFRNTHSLSLN